MTAVFYKPPSEYAIPPKHRYAYMEENSKTGYWSVYVYIPALGSNTRTITNFPVLQRMNKMQAEELVDNLNEKILPNI